MRWVGALLLLLLAVGGWLLTESAAAPTPPPGTSGEAPAAERATAGTGGEPVAVGASVTFPSREPAADEEADVEREAVSTPGTADGARVRVVYQDGSPAALADVWFVTESAWQARADRPRDHIDARVAPQRLGQRSATDREGQVRLPAHRERWLVAAMAGDQFAFDFVPGRRGGTLVLAADETLTIQAVHADGRPAAIAVGVVQQSDRQNGDERQPTQGGLIWHGETDVRGMAVVEHFQAVREAVPDGAIAGTERFAVLARIASTTAPLTRFAGRPAPSEPVRLVVPAIETLTLRFLAHDDAPLLCPALCGLRPPRYPPQDDLVLRATWFLQLADKRVGETQVELPFVDRRAEAIVWARFTTDPRAFGSPRDPQPPDAALAWIVRPDERQAVLRGRFVAAPDGAPLAGRKVTAHLWRAGTRPATCELETIADGRWDAVLPGGGALRLDLRLGTAGGAPDGEELGATVELPEVPGGRCLDLGTIVLAALPPLVHGVVVDDQGVPIADAAVTLNTTQLVPGQVDERGTPVQKQHDVPLRATTAADGTFAIRGARPPGETLTVTARVRSAFPATADVHAPTTPVRLVVERGAILIGRVLLPEWVGAGSASVTVGAEHWPEGERAQTRAIGRDGRFYIGPLRRGACRLHVSMRNLPEPLTVVPDLFLTPGDQRDGRLDPLDLRSALVRHRLRACDGYGQPLPLHGPILAQITRFDGTVEQAAFRWQNGRAELITAPGFVDATFFGRGFEPCQRRLAPGDQDIVLRTLQPALVEVPGARALCGPTRKVRVSVILQGDTATPGSLQGVDQASGERFSFARWDLGRSSGAWLEQGDRVAIPLMTGGTYEVVLRLHATDSTDTPQASISLGSHELQPDGRTLRTVPVDSQAILDAVRRVDEQHRVQLQRGQEQRQGQGQRRRR